MNSPSKNFSDSLKYALGPGLILAAAAIGVSHLVQSTRAGALYGFTLIWAIIIANLTKYPFLEFGPRYTVVMKESLIQGYKRLGGWAIGSFGVFTVFTMCIVQAAVTVVTASLANQLTGLDLSPLIMSAIILVVCLFLLIKGQYSALDGAIKFILIVLTISTLIAVVVAFLKPGAMVKPPAPSVWDATGVSFLIALMGWMPILLDASAWHSLWIMERSKQTKQALHLKETLIDFNIGMVGAGVLALAFLSLGALIMFGSTNEFASSGSAFASQLVELYTSTLGDWAYWIIIICAFTAMFSTTLTVTDAYPRTCSHLFNLGRLDRPEDIPWYSSYRGLLVIISFFSLVILYFAGSNFIFMVDLATSVSFLTAPVFAIINYKLIYSDHFPKDKRPPTWLKWLSWGGMFFIISFAVIFMVWKFILS